MVPQSPTRTPQGKQRGGTVSHAPKQSVVRPTLSKAHLLPQTGCSDRCVTCAGKGARRHPRRPVSTGSCRLPRGAPTPSSRRSFPGSRKLSDRSPWARPPHPGTPCLLARPPGPAPGPPPAATARPRVPRPARAPACPRGAPPRRARPAEGGVAHPSAARA